VPGVRIAAANAAPVRGDGRWVLYWMTAARRPGWNPALQHAADRARGLGRGLVVLEALRCDHRWASARFHAFVIQGMADQARAFGPSGRRPARVTYHPYVEPAPGVGRGLLEALAAQACLVVTDDFPCFFIPRMVAAAAGKLDVRLETVDGNGLMPLRALPKAFARAVDFRAFLQRELPGHLRGMPLADPLAERRDRPALPDAPEIPAAIRARWPAAEPARLLAPGGLDALPVGRGIAPVALHGGAAAGSARLARFIDQGVERYLERRLDLDQPEDPGTSALSPWLHFGHVGAHQAVAALLARYEWTPENLPEAQGPHAPVTSMKKTGAQSAARPPPQGRRVRRGSREGWWGLPAPAEAWLDQLVTWRELGFAAASVARDHDCYDGVPAWARATLARHARDPRPALYSDAELAAGATGDPLWNAAQRQLARDGVMHNYLRMLWGKRVLEWRPDPEAAFATLVEFNNAYALDGRDPNSYSGIQWVLGRYDRPWGPERAIFGTVRYMSSANTARKLDVKGYCARYS
jgi:deoxyribodipyrimidine photo-lyase